MLTLFAAAPPAVARMEFGASPDKADAIVGCMFPMTGRGGLYGRDSVVAIELALAEIRERPGGWPRLRVLIEDTKSKPSLGAAIAQGFIEKDRVQFLCGVVSSAVALAVTEVAKRQRVVFVGTDHASSRLTEEALHRYYFRVTNNTRQSMEAGARYLRELQKRTGWRRLAFIGPDYDYGHRQWSDLREALARVGVHYETAAVLWPKLYEPDYSRYLAALLEAKPDIVVNGHWGGDLVAFIRQARAMKLFERAQFANFDAGGNFEVMAELGADMPVGLILSARHHNNWPDTERNRGFVERFRALAGRYPSYAAQGAYTGMLAIADAVRRAGGARDPEKLVAALERVKLKLPEDPDGFESYMDPATHQMQQVIAIGEVVPDPRFPPAKAMLGRFTVYPPEALAAGR
ncbi:MAG: ABC transporter substrate-binding protein [Betaproteobacteria bacterium]|nr:ABC transporter substrate-binding protein [Betaproteobacteria bacterium]